MTRALRFVVPPLVVLALCGVLLSGAGAAEPPVPACVVVLAPYLTWQDIADGSAPTVAVLAQTGGSASVNLRAGSLAEAPSALRAVAMIAAGRTLLDPGEGSSEVPDAGALGDALRGAGVLTVALGSSAATTSSVAVTHAEVVASDTDGRVGESAGSARALQADVRAPAGISTDFDVLDTAYRAALDRAKASGRQALIVIDPGEPIRASLLAADDDAAWSELRAGAVSTVDATVRLAARSLPSDGVLIVVSTAQRPSSADEIPGFGPLVIRGLDTGTLSSHSTRRPGLVTLPDVGSACLESLGADEPQGWGGARIRSVSSEPWQERLAAHVSLDTRSRAIDSLRMTYWFSLIGIGVVLVVAGAALVLARAGHRLARLWAYALIALMSMPLSSTLYALAPPTHLWLAAVTGAVAAAAIGAAARLGIPEAIMLTCGATAALLAADTLTGANLSLGGLLSYSPLFGGRFYGIGNEGAAVLIGSVLVATGLWFDLRSPDARSAGLVAALGVALVALCVLPFVGANVGVVGWGTLAFGVAWLVATKRRLKWRHALVALGAVVLVLAGSIAADVIAEGPSHLGRLLNAVTTEGPGELASLLERKARLNIEILRATPLVGLLGLALVALAGLLWRPVGTLGRLLRGSAGLRGAVAGALVGGTIGAITEDSGVVVTALLMLYACSVLVALALVARSEARR